MQERRVQQAGMAVALERLRVQVQAAVAGRDSVVAAVVGRDYQPSAVVVGTEAAAGTEVAVGTEAVPSLVAVVDNHPASASAVPVASAVPYGQPSNILTRYTICPAYWNPHGHRH